MSQKKSIAEERGHFAILPCGFLAAFLCTLLFMAPLHAQNAPSESATYDVHLPADGILRTHAGELRFNDAPFAGLKPDGEVSSSARKSHDIPDDHSPNEEAAAAPRPDVNRVIFRKHRWDFSLEGGRFHNNIPFVFDFLLGDGYNMTGLDYTLVPFIASLRWQLSGIHGHTLFRGTWEGSFSATYTMIPRGPETRYFAYAMGIRRNFVQPHWKIIPYAEFRAGAGNINAKQPLGVYAAQGQDFAFTLFMDSGFRYNVNERYALFFGAGYMYISNLYLSEPRYLDYGINVYGPMMGIDLRIGRHRDVSVH